MKKKVFISAAIWGSDYMDFFVSFSLSTQLSPNNIPQLAKECEVTYQIITTRVDKFWLEQQPLFKELEQYCAIRWDLIEDVFPHALVPGEFNFAKYNFLSMLQNFGMSSAIGHDFLILNYADFVWTDGSMPNLIRKFEDDTDAVLSFCLPVDRDSGVAAIRAYAAESGVENGAITLSPRRGAAICLDHLHRETRLRFCDDPTFTVAPTYVLWRAGEEGLIITAYHQTMLAMRVKPADPLYYNGVLTNSLDGYYSAVLGNNSKVAFADNSDEIFIFSLYDTILDSSIGGKSMNNLEGFTRDESLANCMRGMPAGQRRFALHPIEVRREYRQTESWEAAKKLARQTLEALHEKTPFDREIYNKFYASGYHIGFQSFSSNHRSSAERKVRMREKLQRYLLVLLRDIRVFAVTHFIPKNIAVNGNFERWRSARFKCPDGIWTKLPMHSWVGHFDGPMKGRFLRSTLVPDNKSTSSLMIQGADGGNTVNVGQKIPAAALLHIRQKGAITCSGYIRREGPNTGPAYLYLLVPDYRNDFSSYAHIPDIFNILKIRASDTWQYFELKSIDLGNIENLRHGALPYFSVTGLHTPQDKVYFSQVRFNAGYKDDDFSPRPKLLDALMANVYFPLLGASISLLKQLFLRKRRIATAVVGPELEASIKALQLTPFPYTPIFGDEESHIDRHDAIVMMLKGITETLVVKVKDYVRPIKRDGIQLDSRTAGYLWMGTLPERLAQDIRYAGFYNWLLEVAEISLRTLIQKSPHYTEGRRALGRNLWMQGRISEALQQFKYDRDPQQATSLQTHQVALTEHVDLLVKRKILLGDTRPYHFTVSEDPILNQQFFAANRAFFDYVLPYLSPHPEISSQATPRPSLTAVDAESVQRQWDAEKRPPLLSLNEPHRAILRQQKAAWGMREDDWFACLEVRCVGSETLRHDYSFTPIEDYYAAMKTIVDAGGRIVRMGNPSMPPLHVQRYGIDPAKVIDYAHAPNRSEELDVALSAGCRLFISANARLHTIAHAFERPVCSVNVPLLTQHCWHPKEIFIPMLYYHLIEHRFMTLEELMASDALHSEHNMHLFRERIALLRNTPEEIAETVKQVLAGERYTAAGASAGKALQQQASDLSKKYGREITGEMGLYFAGKHAAKLSPARQAEYAAA